MSDDNNLLTVGKTGEQFLSSSELLTSWKLSQHKEATLICCTYNFCHTLERMIKDIFSDYSQKEGIFSAECYRDMVDLVNEIQTHNSKIISIDECFNRSSIC